MLLRNPLGRNKGFNIWKGMLVKVWQFDWDFACRISVLWQFVSASGDWFDTYITSDVFFPSRLEMLFQTSTQDFRQCFNVGRANRRDQECFRLGKLISLFFCPLWKILSRVFLPRERDWETTQDFNFTGGTILGLLDVLRKTKFGKSVLRVAKSNVDMEKEKSKQMLGAHAMTSAVVDVSLNPFWSRRGFI